MPLPVYASEIGVRVCAFGGFSSGTPAPPQISKGLFKIVLTLLRVHLTQSRMPQSIHGVIHILIARQQPGTDRPFSHSEATPR